MPGVKWQKYTYDLRDCWPPPVGRSAVTVILNPPLANESGTYIVKKVSDSQIVLLRIRWWHRPILWIRSLIRKLRPPHDPVR